MKILTFTTLFPNTVFPTRCVFTKERISPLAKMNGCEVKVVAPVPYFPPLKVSGRWALSQVPRRETIDGIDVYHPRYFVTPKIGMSSYGYMMYYGSLPTVRKIREEFDFDIIDAHFVYPDGFAGVLLGRYFRKPVVVTSHGTDMNLYPTFPVIRRFLRHTLNRANCVISVCQAIKDVMVQMGISSEKISVIPNAIDLKKFYPLDKQEARRRLGISAEKMVLSVGALIPIKNHDSLIKAVKILNDRDPGRNISLIIVGEGPMRKKLQKLIFSLGMSGQVRLAGSVPHQELHLWFSAADLSSLPSRREGWPCVILESLACGTPVVASDVWGIPEIIRSDRVGLLTKTNEWDIAEKLDTALNTSWDSEEIVQYAREYTWERFARDIHDVYCSVLRNP